MRRGDNRRFAGVVCDEWIFILYFVAAGVLMLVEVFAGQKSSRVFGRMKPVKHVKVSALQLF